MTKNENRTKIIKQTTIITISTNVLLGIIKLSIGLLLSSVAFLSDGVNNITDSLSSFVTLLGYKASKKRATKSHPFGYGRIEYLSSLFVACLILLTGFSFFFTSIKAVINRTTPERISTLMLIILFLTIIVKISLFFFLKKEGKKANSEALNLSSLDSLFDALITLLTVISSLLSKHFTFSFDGSVGIIISIFILYNGIKSIISTSDTIIGKRPEKEEIAQIRAIIAKYPPLLGGYDIRLHSYGPDSTMGTIDVEVPFSATAESVYEAMEKAKKELRESLNIEFTFGMNAENQEDPRVKEMMDKTLQCLKLSSSYVLGIHGFHVHFDEKRIEFDVVVDFLLKDWDSFRANMTELLELLFPDYSVSFNIDPDYS